MSQDFNYWEDQRKENNSQIDEARKRYEDLCDRKRKGENIHRWELADVREEIDQLYAYSDRIAQQLEATDY